MDTKEHKVAFYAEDGEGTYTELIIDFYNRCYDFNCEFKEQYLYCKNSGIKVSREDIYKIYDSIENLYDGGYCLGSLITPVDQETEGHKPLISSRTLQKAVKGKLSRDELGKIISFDYRYEKGDYYNYKVIMDTIYRVMAGKITVIYFKRWLVLMMRCLTDNTLTDEKIKAEYAELADWFDGFAFMGADIGKKQKLRECREIIAVVKYANHKIKNLKKNKNTDFTTNGVITYVSFAFALDNGRACLDRVCVVDKKRKRINYMYVKETDYREDINYTLLSEAEFEDLCNIYLTGYKPDLSMSADYAAKRSSKLLK